MIPRIRSRLPSLTAPRTLMRHFAFCFQSLLRFKPAVNRPQSLNDLYRRTPSRAVGVRDDVPLTLHGDEMAKYATGDRVAHSQYGDGTVHSVNEYHTVIDFDAHGVHTFSSPRVVLAASLTPPPVRPAKPARRSKRPSLKAS
jgi:hypothetical protein